MRPDLSVYLVTDAEQSRRKGRDLVRTVREAVAGGVTTVQIREKHASTSDMLQLIEDLSEHLPQRVTVIINDRIDVYLAARQRGLRADGVHVGQHDMPVGLVRELVGPDAMIGLSAQTAAHLAAAAARPERVDYVGIGTVRATSSKADAPPPLGVHGVAALARTCPLPAVAIGGITPEDLPPLRAAGLAGAAVVSFICASPDPQAAAAALSHAWKVTA